MANRSQSRFSARVRAPKRVTEWVSSADQGWVVVSAGAKLLSQSSAGLGNTTIVRVRGQLSVKPNISTADQDIVGAYGIGIVSDQAFAAGATSLSGPWSDSDWGGWLVWMPISMRYEFQDGTGALITSVSQVIDSKAMRKVQMNETLVVMIESQAIAFDVADPFRLLVKLA